MDKPTAADRRDQSVESLLINGRLEEALDRIREVNRSAQENSELWAGFKSQYESYLAAYDQGQITFEDFQRNKNRLSQAVLGLVQGVTKALQPYFHFYSTNPLGDWDTANLDSLRVYLSTRLDGKYHIEPVPLGEGNTCIVFKINELYTGRSEVLRVLKTANLKGLEEEVRRVSRLKHRNLMSVHEVFFREFPYFVTTEYVPSESLDVYLDRYGRRPFFEVRDMVARLGDALQYLRDKKIYLSLVRPSKILLDDENQPVLSPFDIIKASDPARAKDKVKEDCLYMAPEWLEKETLVPGPDNTGAADQYSLALLVYELLVGRPLFARGYSLNGSSRRRDLSGVPLSGIFKNRERFDQDRRFRAECLAELTTAGSPKALNAVVDRMLRREPEARFPDFAEAIHALTAIPSGVPEATRAVLESYQRCLRASDDFIGAFYQKVQQSGHFPAEMLAFSDMDRQRKMFRGIVALLTEAAQKHPFFTRLPDMTGHRGLQAGHYRRFLDLLLETVAETDSLWPARPQLREHWQRLVDKLLEQVGP